MNVDTAIKEANNLLKNVGIKTYKLDVEILMLNISKLEKKDIILNRNIEISNESYNRFKKLVYERSLNKPVSYLLNKKSFWKNEFFINEDVLIPRPETEHLVDEALKLTKGKSGNILDLGIGSGCIILSILNENKKLRGVGIDIKKGPIFVSKINAKKLGIKNRVKFFKSDIDNFNLGKYDLIVSNPPYIKFNKLKELENNVIRYEPIIALNGGLDGTSEIRKVINTASKLIKINGKFLIEIAFDQKNKVIELIKRKGFFINKIIKDYSNKDRCIVSTKT